jgi:hypothetical protein
MIIGLLMPVICLSASSLAEEAQTLNIAVWSDIHLMAPSLLDGLSGNAAGRSGKMRYESEALLDVAFELLKQRETKPDILIIPGDLTNDGEKASHELLAQKLDEVKNYFPGIKIYVIDGDHDINRNGAAKTYVNGYAEDTEWITDAQFQDIYAGFGYNDPENEYYTPLLGDYGLNSYVARPAEGFTLIAIDADNHSDGLLADELLEWILEKAGEAQERDDAIIAIMHRGLVPHLTVEPKYWGDCLVQRYEYIARTLADAGIRWIFTGDMHANDIAEHTTEAGNTIYDIETGSPVTYPFPLRYITFTKNAGKETLHSETGTIASINYNNPNTNQPVADLEAYYIPAYMSENQIIDAVIEHAAADLADSLMTVIAAAEYSPAEGVVHTGSRALIESLLQSDLADVVPTLFSNLLPTTEAEGVKVDVSGNPLTIWRDDEARRIKISGSVTIFGAKISGVAAITDENLNTHLITPAFNEIDAEFMQNSTYMHNLVNTLIREIGNYPLETGYGANHSLAEATFLAWLGYLAGEENPAFWAIDILNGLKYGSTTDILLDHVMQVIVAEINNTILPATSVNTSNLITHDSGNQTFTITIKAGLIIKGVNNVASLFDLISLDITTIAGDALNSGVVPLEYRHQLTGLIVEMLESLMYDTNDPDDNNTTLYWESEGSVSSVSKVHLSDSITLYPNPLKEELYIETTLNIKEINIYDVYGKTIKQVKGLPTFIPVGELPSGVYFIKCLTGEGSICVKKAVK